MPLVRGEAGVLPQGFQLGGSNAGGGRAIVQADLRAVIRTAMSLRIYTQAIGAGHIKHLLLMFAVL